MKNKEHAPKTKEDKTPTAKERFKKIGLRAAIAGMAIAATLGVGNALNNSNDDTKSETTMSQEASPTMVEVETLEGETIQVELEELSAQEALAVIEQDYNSIQGQGVWWVGGYKDEDGKMNIIGGSNINSTNQYTEAMVDDFTTDESGNTQYSAYQTLRGYVESKGNPGTVKAFKDFTEALKISGDAAGDLAKVYTDNDGTLGPKGDEEPLNNLDTANKKAKGALLDLYIAMGGESADLTS